MRRSASRRVIWSMGLSLFALGCVLLSLRPTDEVTPTPLPPTVTPLPTETSAPASTPTSVPTPSPTPDPCPPSKQIAFPERPEVHLFERYSETLRTFLAAGGNPTQIGPGLAEWDVLPPERDAGPLRGDLTGNGVTETAVAFIDTNAETFPPPGALVIFACRDGTIETLASYTPGTGNYLWLRGIADLTQDGIADLVFTDVTCGAHTCWYTAHVWSWSGEEFQEQIDGLFSLPYAFLWAEKGRLYGRSGGIGSVGAGPQRVYTETWQWNGQVITFANKTVGPAQFRYHAFRDGDVALFAEDYDEAFDAYLQVINDETLDPWAGMYSAEEERQALTALAEWRLFTLGMKLGNFPDAEMRYERLQTEYPSETPAHAVTVLAERFWSRYQETGNVAYGCLEVIDMPEAEQVLSFLNSFGYANPFYAAEDLCPFLTP